MITAIIPVKAFTAAKTRLSPLLSPAERAALSAAMLEDVVIATVATPQISATLIVTPEPAAAAIATFWGARIVVEVVPAGLNAAIATASRAATEWGAEGIIVVPADLPQLTAGALSRAARYLSSQGTAVLARAVADGGTNLLGVRPVGLAEPSFGPGSFNRHRAALLAAGIDAAILQDEETDRDLDCPADLEHFWKRGAGTRTRAFLASIRIGERLRDRAAGMPALNGAAS